MTKERDRLRRTGCEQIEIKHLGKRGQVWSLDFITSIVIFLSVLIPLFFLWGYVNTQNQQQIFFDENENLALSVSDALVRAKGLPEDWNASDVNVIGLASEENVLSNTKVSYFLAMGGSDYNRTRTILTGGKDFFFNLTDLNGTSYGVVGNKPEDRMIVPVERYCLYNDRIVKLEFALVI
jgi:hypothetical protein